MGTRSLTKFINAEGETCALAYKQYDGYPTGYGTDLATFLSQFTVVNGIPVGDSLKLANGIECLAAQVVAEFKDGAGGYYLYPTNYEDCGQEYYYTITQDTTGDIIMEVSDMYDYYFKGTPLGFLESLKDK